MMRPQHLRMARAGLGWTLKELADRAEVNLNTVSRYEAGREVLTGTVDRIERVLEAEGIIFLYEDAAQGPGIRLPRKSANVSGSANLKNRKKRS